MRKHVVQFSMLHHVLMEKWPCYDVEFVDVHDHLCYVRIRSFVRMDDDNDESTVWMTMRRMKEIWTIIEKNSSVAEDYDRSPVYEMKKKMFGHFHWTRR